MRTLLLQLDTSAHPSVFDRVVALDGGAEEVMSYGGVTEDAVRDLVHGAIFTRGPKDLRHTAIFIGGTDMAAGERILAAVQKAFFGPMRVSVMLDSNGSNTTAVAAVSKLQRGAGTLEGRRAVVTAGTGPVGARAAGLLAMSGAQVTITSRRQEGGALVESLGRRFGGSVRSVVMADASQAASALEGAELLLNAGPAGVQLVPRGAWTGRSVRAAADVNAVPPSGIEGIDVRDDGVEREGAVVFGALGVGGLKMKIHKACIARLFERNDLVLDAETIAEVARDPVVEGLTLLGDVTHVLIAGLSSRAAADSAVRAGFAVTTIDAYADLDLHPSVRGLSASRNFGTSFSPEAAARAVSDLVVEAVVYGSNFENHPAAVTSLATGRTLWGNPPEVLRRVRDPRQLDDLFRIRGIPAPEVRVNASNDPNDWLVKPLSSGGGRGVRRWTGGAIPRGCYLQQRIDGVPGSLVFVAAGGRSIPLAISRQLVGDAAFGADGFMYCGNILAAAGDSHFAQDEALLDAASAIACATAEGFDLVGVNGVDFVAANGVPYPVEVNPRWCASMELVERAYGVSMFGLHAAACAAGTLPVFDLSRARRGGHAVGKAIVFARSDVTMGDTRQWLEDPTVRDVPHPGERIAEGHPICTVFAEGPDASACYDALVQRAANIYSAQAS